MNAEPVPPFEELAVQLSPQLRAYLQRMVRNPADADDLLNDTLLRIARNLPNFEGRASVKTWAYRIASNVAIDFLRKSSRNQTIEFDEAVTGDPEVAEDDEDRLILDEMNDCVRQVIEGLPPAYRSALILHDLQGMNMAETAQALEISLANAKVRIHRARGRLREALNRECDFYTSNNGALRCDRKPPHSHG